MASSNPATALECLLDLTYRSAEAENDPGVVAALKAQVRNAEERSIRFVSKKQTRHRFVFLFVVDVVVLLEREA